MILKKLSILPILFGLLIVFFIGTRLSAGSDTQTHEKIDEGANCPVNSGHKGIVPESQHIFCAKCYWHGQGPVYVAFAWASPEIDEAVFSFSTARKISDVTHSVKTSIVIAPTYSGEFRIKGAKIDSQVQEPLMFDDGSKSGAEIFQYRINRNEQSEDWPFVPIGLLISSSGCYALEITTSQGHESIIFKATR